MDLINKYFLVLFFILQMSAISYGGGDSEFWINGKLTPTEGTLANHNAQVVIGKSFSEVPLGARDIESFRCVIDLKELLPSSLGNSRGSNTFDCVMLLAYESKTGKLSVKKFYISSAAINDPVVTRIKRKE